MHTDKDNPASGTEQAVETADSSQESTLNWLMDLDRDEPQENLFVVDRKDAGEIKLSAFEAEIAARPMTRGRAGADDFDSYVGEEIVISSEGTSSDIYNTGQSMEAAPDTDDSLNFEEAMALDFTHRESDWATHSAVEVEDGSDILGLEDEDDIGDTFLVVKRKNNAEPVEAPVVPVQAPVQELVAETPEIPAATAQEISSIEVRTDVQDYVNSVAAPVDEQAFDDYLVAGSELHHGDDNIDELTLEMTDEEFSADGVFEIDYHEDFQSLADAGEAIFSAVTPRIGALMEELEKALAVRLSAQGKPADSVHADFSLATDEASVEQALGQGYQILSAVCSETPESLAELSSGQLDAIYLRLSWVDSGEACNGLFLDEEQSDTAQTSGTPVLKAVDNSVFEEDFLGGDLEAELAPEGWQPGKEDIDSIFDDFGDDDFELEFNTLSMESEAGTGDDMSQPVTAEHSPIEETLRVFDEDIFNDELSDESLLSQTASSEDIDALFDDLGHDGVAEDDICGIHVEEFAESGSAPEIAETQPEQPVPAAADSGAAEDMAWCIPADIRFSHSSPASGEIFAEFLDAFIEEGSSELEKLEDAFTEWEANISSEAAYTVVTRILHTIKGIAKGVGLHYYGTLIHNFETLLDSMPRPGADEEQAYFRIVNAWLDAAVRGLDHIQGQRRDITNEFPHRGEETVAEEQPGESVAAAEPAVVEPEAAKVQAAPTAAQARRKQVDKKLADEGAKALAAQQSVRITSEKLDLLLNLSNQAQQLGVRTAQSTTRNKRNSAELQARLSSFRTHIADIADGALFNVTARGSNPATEMDALEMDQYTEIQEAANILREGVEDLAELIEIASRQNAQAEVLLKQQATVISSIGSSLRAARVVPVSRLMPGLRRLVRTVSNDLDKEVAFRVANEVGTLDRDDYARCQTILEHMVRNALDHGIESGTQRQATGKQSVGQITVDVRMSGADSVIVLSDDGRGIDPEAMRESAITKGLDIDVYALSDQDALGLIFHKGFSTAKSVSQISGRGVGMDIVLSELQQMGGDIHIESQVGKGTSFHIRIPSNVTVNGALLVTAGDNSYAIPLGGLISVDYIPVEDFFGAVESGGKLELAGMSCDPAYLGTLCQSGNLPDKAFWRKSVPVIIAGSDERHMAIAIDDVEEALELVIRSLGAQFSAVPGVAGAATTADGEAVVALDLNVLVSCFDEGQGTPVEVDQPEEAKFLALVVDDSRTQRMVATSQLETVGIETATAENGAVAIDWLNTTEHLPDVILLDVEMPVKDGIQTLREIRKSARYSHIPVIMVTSRTGVKHRTLAEEAGCNGYMGKPFNFRMLIGQINELTGHRLQLA